MKIGWAHSLLLSPMHHGYKWVILINLIVAGILGSSFASAGFIGESTLQGALRLSRDQMGWVSISYIMMLGIVIPLAVYLAERYGYKLLFFGGMVIFLTGSLLAGLAFDFLTVTVSKALAGIGAGILFPISITLIDDVFPKELLTIALALYVGVVFGGGTALGFLGGGYLVQYVAWNSPFLICAALGAVVLLATWLLHQESLPHADLKFDKAGYTTFIVFICSILLMLNSAKAEWNVEGWNSSFMWGCYTLALLSLAVLIVLELKSPNPVILFHLFTIRSFFLGCMIIFFVGAPLYGTLIEMTHFLDSDLHYEKHTAGLYLTTLGITLGVISTSTAFLSTKNNIRLLTLLGVGLITVSCFMQPQITLYSSHARFLWISNLRMAGIGLALGPATVLALSDVNKALAGAAAVFITLFRQIGGTLGSLGLGVVSVERGTFHRLMYGSHLNPESPAFKAVIKHLKEHLIHQTGAVPSTAEAQASALIRENIATQSHATSLGDGFFLLGIATALCFICLLIEMGWSAYTHLQEEFSI